MLALRGLLVRVAPCVAAMAVASCTPGRAGEEEEAGGGGGAEGPATRVEILREIQLTRNARLPEEHDGRLVEVQVHPDRLVFVYSGAPEVPLEVGHVVAGTEAGGYLRRLTAVREIEPDRLEADTVPAELGELIGDGHFVVHFAPGSGAADGGSGGGDVAGRRDALTGGINLFPESVTGVPCDVSVGGSTTLEPRFDMTMAADIEIDIRWNYEWWIPRGRLEYARFELSGSIAPGATIEASGNGTLSCEWDAAETFGLDRLKKKWVTTVMVGLVPVTITHTVAPTLTVTGSGSVGTGPSTMVADGTFAFRAGAEYARPGGWVALWDPSRSGNASLTANEPGDLGVSAEASGGIGYLAKLYDTAGPGVGFGPSLSGTFTASADTCELSAEASGGLSASIRARLDVPAFDHTLAELSRSYPLAGATLGTWNDTAPWCEDAGMPLDGGMPDPCSSADTCQACNDIAGCGYCEATGECTSDSQRDGCDPTEWRDSPSECEVCTGYGSCGECLGDAFCGWCASSGRCLTARSGGAPPEPCDDWLYSEPASMCR
jgi:hypothetical protein